jgi:hypothetical protein
MKLAAASETRTTHPVIMEAFMEILFFFPIIVSFLCPVQWKNSSGVYNRMNSLGP